MFKSISGFTKKYAEWISQEIKADLLEENRDNLSRLGKYDIIIFGGSLSAIGINGIKLFKKYLQEIKDRKIIIYAVGASPHKDGIEEEIINANFNNEEKRLIKFYYLRGGFNFGKLNIKNKILMTLLKYKLKLKRNKTPDEFGMLSAYENPVDYTKKDKITEIIKYVRAISSKLAL